MLRLSFCPCRSLPSLAVVSFCQNISGSAESLPDVRCGCVNSRPEEGSSRAMLIAQLFAHPAAITPFPLIRFGEIPCSFSVACE